MISITQLSTLDQRHCALGEEIYRVYWEGDSLIDDFHKYKCITKRTRYVPNRVEDNAIYKDLLFYGKSSRNTWNNTFPSTFKYVLDGILHFEGGKTSLASTGPGEMMAYYAVDTRVSVPAQTAMSPERYLTAGDRSLLLNHLRAVVATMQSAINICEASPHRHRVVSFLPQMKREYGRVARILAKYSGAEEGTK